MCLLLSPRINRYLCIPVDLSQESFHVEKLGPIWMELNFLDALSSG